MLIKSEHHRVHPKIPGTCPQVLIQGVDPGSAFQQVFWEILMQAIGLAQAAQERRSLALPPQLEMKHHVSCFSFP